LCDRTHDAAGLGHDLVGATNDQEV
jgi:hypothetical protein